MVEVTIPKCKFWPVCTGQQTMWNNTQENSSRPRRFSIAEKAHGIVDSKGKKTSGAKHFISKLLFELLSFMNSDVMRLNFFKISNSINNIWRYFLITIGKSNGRGGESKYFPLTSEGGVRKSRWPPTTIPLPRPTVTEAKRSREDGETQLRFALSYSTRLDQILATLAASLRFVFGGRSPIQLCPAFPPDERNILTPMFGRGLGPFSNQNGGPLNEEHVCNSSNRKNETKKRRESRWGGEKGKGVCKIVKGLILMDRLVRFSGA